MVTALPGPAALRTLWLPHGNGFALVLLKVRLLATLAEPLKPASETQPPMSHEPKITLENAPLANQMPQAQRGRP